MRMISKMGKSDAIPLELSGPPPPAGKILDLACVPSANTESVDRGYIAPTSDSKNCRIPRPVKPMLPCYVKFDLNA